MSWRISFSTWQYVEYHVYEQRGGKLFRSNEFPNQWKWRGDIVFADSIAEAKGRFELQFRPAADYWERIGTGNFMWVVGAYRGAIHRHKGDRTLWKFKEFAFHADSEKAAYELLFERFGRLETA